MRRFFQSGYAFIVVALLSFIAAMNSARPTVFISVGAVFLILALAVRKKNRKDTAGSASK